MHLQSMIQRPWGCVVVALSLSGLLDGHVRGDDLKINTPVVSANLLGIWELQPQGADEYKQTLHLGPQFTGEWQQSRETLPVSIAWFVEGGELRILHYYEPAEPFNYRVKSLMVPYKITDDILSLTFDGKPSRWNRTKVAVQDKP